MRIDFLNILTIFMHFVIPVFGLSIFLSKGNGQNQPDTFTVKPDIHVSLRVKLHVTLRATIMIQLPLKWGSPLRLGVSWAGGRHFKWRFH